VVNSILHDTFDFPGFDSSIHTCHIRLIGYGCLALVLILIVIGLIAEKRGLAAAGAITFFLPDFGRKLLNYKMSAQRVSPLLKTVYKGKY